MILPDMQSIPGGGGQTGEGARDTLQTQVIALPRSSAKCGVPEWRRDTL